MYTPQNKIVIFDTTLRDGEQAPGCHIGPEEKLIIARALSTYGVDIIEAGFPVSSPGDHHAVYTISQKITKPIIAALGRAVIKDIDACGDALDPAIKRGRGRIHTFIATSQIHMDGKLRKSPEEVQEMAVNAINHAKRYTSDIEFSTEDFGRSSNDYIASIVGAAIKAGATTINLPDTVGFLLPYEMQEKVADVIHLLEKDGVNLDGIVLSTHNHNDLGNATANTCAAILSGVRQVEGTINGLGERAGNAALEEVIANIEARGRYEINPVTGAKDPFYGLDISHIKLHKLKKVSDIVARVMEVQVAINKAIVGRNAFAHESGIHQHGCINDKNTYEWIMAETYGCTSELPLGPRSGIHAISCAVAGLGFTPSEAEMRLIAKRFVRYTEEWKQSDTAHIIQAVREDPLIPQEYEIIMLNPSAHYSKGRKTQGRAVMKIRVGEEVRTVYAEGNGEIDAAANAFKQIAPFKFDIVDYGSKGIGEGSSAVGKESIKISTNGYNALGTGMNTSTVIGAAKAVEEAVNRMAYVMKYAPEQPKA